MSRRKDARVTYDVMFWSFGNNWQRVLENVNKRTAVKEAKRLGIGSLVTKKVSINNQSREWSRKPIYPQPVAPFFENGKRMDNHSYIYYYLGSNSEGMNESPITPITEVA